MHCPMSARIDVSRPLLHMVSFAGVEGSWVGDRVEVVDTS